MFLRVAETKIKHVIYLHSRWSSEHLDNVACKFTYFCNKIINFLSLSVSFPVVVVVIVVYAISILIVNVIAVNNIVVNCGC